MTEKNKGEGGFLSGLMERAKDSLDGIVEFTDDEVPASAGSSKSVTPIQSAPAFASTPFNSDNVKQVIPSTPLTVPTFSPQVDPSIRKQIDDLLRQNQTPGVAAVVRFEAEFNKLSMISNLSERRTAALAVCGVTIESLLSGYKSMLDQLVGEKENDKNYVAGKISEMIESNNSEQQRLGQEIRANEDEILRLQTSNDSLKQQLSSLDSRVSGERQRYERGGAVFQVTAESAEEDLRKIINDLTK